MLRITLTLLLALCFQPAAYAGPINWNPYNALLQQYIVSGEKNGVRLNLVDYPAIAADTRWPHILKQLADSDLHSLHNKKQQLAFWINSYNILAIKTVLDHWPLQSIRDAGSFFSPVWKKPVAVVAGQMRSLDEIEHHILRAMHEPRIHFAIVCASVSCPDLRPEAYDAAQLDAQLDDQAAIFLSRQQKGLRNAPDGVQLSKIFDWFEADFSSRGGVIAFIRQYRPELSRQSSISSYLDYDWSLNSTS